MNPSVIALIFQGINLVGTIGPIIMETALALQRIFTSSGSEYTVQIQTLQDGAVHSAQQALDMIAQWKQEHGYTD